jgi:hypothetical protein
MEPAKLADLLPLLESKQADGLRCEIATISPVLDFSFRFRAGFTVRLPLAQFSGTGHNLGMLVRVRPEAGGAPIYLGAKFDVPEFAPASGNMEVGGGFLAGTGQYAARSVVYDETGRACHHEWAIHVPASPEQSHVAMPANTAAPLSPAHTATTAGQATLDGLTVLLDAAPINPQMSRLSLSDVITLTNGLVSLLEALPARRVHLVVFNLDLQKELLREDNFTAEGIERVQETLNAVQVATVDYHVLQNRGGHLDLLADMVNREQQSAAPSDAVIFLSPRVRYHDKVAIDWKPGRAGKPQFYSIQFQPVLLRTITSNNPVPCDALPVNLNEGGSLPPELGGCVQGENTGHLVLDDESPDSITLLVSLLKGRSFAVRSPKDFAKVIRHIIQASGRR